MLSFTENQIHLLKQCSYGTGSEGFILMALIYWCVGYKTLALFIYIPVMWCILRLATMEVKNESTHEIILFWKLFNEILSQITERGHKFNPKAILMDETIAHSDKYLAFILWHQVWLLVRCATRITSIIVRTGSSSRDNLKVSAMGCVPQQLWNNMMSEDNGWMKLLICSQTYLNGWHSGTQGSITCFLFSDDLATPTSHWLKAALQCSRARHNYGYWSCKRWNNIYAYTSWRIYVIDSPDFYFQWERTELHNKE